MVTPIQEDTGRISRPDKALQAGKTLAGSASSAEYWNG
jgi:hypothetical protein